MSVAAQVLVPAAPAAPAALPPAPAFEPAVPPLFEPPLLPVPPAPAFEPATPPLLLPAYPAALPPKEPPAPLPELPPVAPVPSLVGGGAALLPQPVSTLEATPPRMSQVEDKRMCRFLCRDQPPLPPPPVAPV